MSEKAIWEYLKTLKTGTDIQYIDIASGDFIVSSGVNVDGNIYANVGSETAIIVFQQVKIRNQLAAGSSVKICDISDVGKVLLGQTYISSMLSIYGRGMVTDTIFNTYDSGSEITVRNSTGSALAANTELNGTITIMRT